MRSPRSPSSRSSADVAVVLVAHLNKSEGSRLVNRVVGSVAFVDAARSFVAFGRDPDDPDGEKGTRRVIVPTACNWGSLAKSLAANVESRPVDLHDGSTTSVGYLNVTGESDVVVEDLQRGPGDGADGNDVDAAILAALTDGQPHTPREIKAAVGAELGCAWKTVQRAAEHLEADGFRHRDMSRGPRLATWTAIADTSLTPLASTIENSPETLGETDRGRGRSQERVRNGDDLDAELCTPHREAGRRVAHTRLEHPLEATYPIPKGSRMSTPATPTDAPFNPGKYALEALVASGDLEGASKLAVKLTAATPAAPVAPVATSTPDPDRTLTFSQMKGLTMEEMTALRIDEPKVYQRSLEHLRDTAPASNNRASNAGS